MRKDRNVSRFVLGIFLLSTAVPLALAQSKDPGNKGSNTSRGGASVPPSNQPPINNPRPPKPEFQTVYITGRVVQEDGSPIPSGAVIERICGGRAKKEAYVSPSGSFGFQFGGARATNDVLPDASDDSFGGLGTMGDQPGQPRFARSGFESMSSTSLMGCELRADLAGYRSSSIMLDGFTPMGTMDVGTILLKPVSKTQGSTISLTDMQAPKSAKKPLERADKAVQRNDLAEAEKNLKVAIEAYPKYATAWYKLGLLYQSQKRNQEARDAYTKAISADSQFVNPYIQLARLAGMEQKWQEVAEVTDKALALDSLDFPEGYFFNSIAYYYIGKLDIAERSARKAQRLDPLHRLPRTNLILADILEKKHDLPGCIEQLQGYLKITPLPSDADKVRSRIQKLEESTGPMAGNQVPNP